MGLLHNFDNLSGKAKDLAGEHSDKVNDGLGQAGEFIGEKTGGQYGDQIDLGVDQAKDYLGTTEGERQ